LSNTLITLWDNKISVGNSNDNSADFYEARVLSATDYYAFGMAMKGRTWQSESYRYGFNNMEKGEETGTHHFKYREDDQDAGRFWSVDPLTAQYPWNSP